jgi:pimeloyl-ACP methyl ester carboxylesterase
MEATTRGARKRKYAGPERRQSARWRPRRLRLLLAVLGVVVVGYTGAILWLLSQETRLVFEAGAVLGPKRPPFPYEQVNLPRADGAQQFAWVMPAGVAADERYWVLFLHGNASNLASHFNISHYTLLRAAGLSVLAPEYRGFAGLPGLPTEEALGVDARAAYDYLRLSRNIPATHVVIYGWSLGSAVAVDLASQVEEAAVILEGAPASVVDIAQQRYPFFPLRHFMRNQFESYRRIDRVGSPVLFLHSPEDAVIPISEGRRLYDAARGDKRFVEVRGGHVNASELDTAHFSAVIGAFLQDHHIRTSNAGVERP